MILKEKYKYFIEYFEKNMPIAKSELNYENPYQLIVAVILSAQCTDKRVNMTTPALFERYPDAEALSKATVEEIYELIKSISYPNNKSKNLLGMAKVLMSDFNGIVPEDVDKLQTLPGVGRKTANVVLSNAFGQDAMAVDTHVFRVSNRIGIVDTQTPEKTEFALMEAIPKKRWSHSHHVLIFHGRRICKARKPECEICPITKYCKYYKNNFDKVSS